MYIELGMLDHTYRKRRDMCVYVCVYIYIYIYTYVFIYLFMFMYRFYETRCISNISPRPPPWARSSSSWRRCCTLSTRSLIMQSYVCIYIYIYIKYIEREIGREISICICISQPDTWNPWWTSIPHNVCRPCLRLSRRSSARRSTRSSWTAGRGGPRWASRWTDAPRWASTYTTPMTKIEANTYVTHNNNR